jgi:glycoprotein endo-alpha-1,2-mannosidase
MQKQIDSQKKSSRKKYLIPAVILLGILTGLAYRAITWTPVDSESKKASVLQLNTDLNELTRRTHGTQNISLGEVNTGTENHIAEFIPVPQKVSYDIGAYYYPWYFNDFHGGHYLRKHLIPQQEPALGEYNDRNKDVITQQLKWSRYAGINLWAASWWGPGSREDVTILNHILKNPDLGDFKIAVFYETEGRTKSFTDYSNLDTDITYLAENYFRHPNYLKINGKAVLFIYQTRILSARGTLKRSLDTIRKASAVSKCPLYIVGDHAFGSSPNEPNDMTLFDGITNYDVYGSMGAAGYATQTKVDSYFSSQLSWKLLAESAGVTFIPSVTPGFNDRAVRSGHAPLSRKLTDDQEFGSLFRAMIKKAKNLTDSSIGRLIMVTSWNEWHEDTQIEPVKIASATNLDDSKTGHAYTDNLSFEGYGERYLQILREEIIP